MSKLRGKHILVNVHTPERGEDERKGYLSRRRVPEYLHRRKVSGIRFFDLGYIKSGDAWVNLPFVDPLAALPLELNTYNGAIKNQRTFIESDLYEYTRDLIYQIPQEEWTRNYKQIDDTLTSQTFAMAVYFRGNFYELKAASDYWQNGVFKPDKPDFTDFTPEELPLGDVGFLFNPFGYLTTGGAGSKITTTLDYDAPAVTDFVPSKTMDVFLMPLYFASQVTQTEAVTGLYKRHLLNLLAMIAPREALLDPSHPFYGRMVGSTTGGAANYGFGTNHSYNAASGDPEINRQQQGVREYLLAYEGRRAAERILTNGNAWSGGPMPPGDYGDGMTNEKYAAFTSWNFATLTENGNLAAVIRQGGALYYCWLDHHPDPADQASLAAQKQAYLDSCDSTVYDFRW